MLLPVCPKLTYNAVHIKFNLPFHTPKTSKNMTHIDIAHRTALMNGVMLGGADL